MIRVHLLAFARIREALGSAEQSLTLPSGATGEDAWRAIAERAPLLQGLERSTRLAINGTVVEPSVALHDGDELALLPPVGGG